MTDAPQATDAQGTGPGETPAGRKRGRPRKVPAAPPAPYSRMAQLGHQNTEAQKSLRAAQDAQMLALTLQGKTVREIAGEVGIGLSNVYRRLPPLLDGLAEQNRGLVQRELVQQLGRLDHLLSRALTQFEKSCEAETEVTREDAGGNPDGDGGAKTYGVKGGRRTVTTRQKNSPGDPRFLTEARQILAERRKLLGFDREEVRAQVINQFILADVSVTNTQNNTLEISAQEADEMARIMGSLGLTPSPSAGSGLTRALPAPGESRREASDPDGDGGEFEDWAEGIYRDEDREREDRDEDEESEADDER